MDLFYRINKECDATIQFEDLTTYLIDHEIAFDAELGTNGGLNATNSGGISMEYVESPISDPTTHNNYIEQIFYFQQIDKVILYEQNMKNMRIYNGLTMKHEVDIACPGVILAIEYVSDKNSICVSLSDRTFLFYDATSYKHQKKLSLPSTQRCLCYVKRKRVLFSAGTDGAVWAWLVDKIFVNDYDDNSDDGEKKDADYKNFITENTPWFLMTIASCIVDLPNIDLIATGSYKGRIELWVLRTQNNTPQVEDKDMSKKALTKSSKDKGKKKEAGLFGKKLDQDDDISKLKKKTLEGHKRAIREIAYSEQYKILVSVGFDFQIFVWNPYWEKEIIKLDGHESPLVGVNCPPGLDCFITCDTKGLINVWNIKDYSQMQTFSVSNVNQVTSMRVVQKHRRLLIGSRVFKVFEYQKPFIPDVSDDNPILCALYSNIRHEFYIAGGRQINIWNAKKGMPTRCLKNCVDSDITAMALDKEHRKLIVGSHLGKIKVFDILSGVCTNNLESHSEENGEISFIGYGDDDLSIITTAWDKTIKIHKDDRDEQKKPPENVMRAKRFCHKKDIICGDYAHNLGLIATGGRDNKVRVWEYERMKFEDEIQAFNEVSIVKFLKPFPILMVADNTGWIHIWLLEYPPFNTDGKKLIVSWRNNHSLEKVSPLSAIDSYYNHETGDFWMIMGDESGMVKVQDLSPIIREYKLRPVDIVTGNTKRNPHRCLPTENYTLDKLEAAEGAADDDDAKDSGLKEEPESNLKGGDIQCINQFQAHKDIIKSIQFIAATDEPLIFTAGLDRCAYIWDLEKRCRGKLIQGYMLKPNYYWDFPLNQYHAETRERQSNVLGSLVEIREEREKDKTYKKQKEVAHRKYGHLRSSLGFAGAAMLSDTMDGFATGMTTKTKDPANFVMSKEKEAANSMATTIYDDTGRAHQTMKVQRLLDQAKRVIAAETKKANKARMKETGQTSVHRKNFNTMNTTKMSAMGMTGGMMSNSMMYSQMDVTEDEMAKEAARKIGPFSFDIDDDIGTPVLTDEQVYDDLKELEDIMEEGASNNQASANLSMGKSKRKRR